MRRKNRMLCWNCYNYYPRDKNDIPYKLSHACYKVYIKVPNIEKFEQRDPFKKYSKELKNLNWTGFHRVRKPSLEVQDFFEKVRRIRRKLKMLFRITIIIIRLQREASERAYAPGGIGYYAYIRSLQSLSVN